MYSFQLVTVLVWRKTERSLIMFCVLRRRLYGEGFSRHPIRLLVLGVHVRLLSFVHDVSHDVALHKLPLTVCHTTDKTF